MVARLVLSAITVSQNIGTLVVDGYGQKNALKTDEVVATLFSLAYSDMQRHLQFAVDHIYDPVLSGCMAPRNGDLCSMSSSQLPLATRECATS